MCLLIRFSGRDNLNREMSSLWYSKQRGPAGIKQGPLKSQQTLPILLEPDLGLFGNETDLPNLVTRGVNVKSTGLMVGSSRREIYGWETLRSVRNVLTQHSDRAPR